jgi:hypothetical protein
MHGNDRRRVRPPGFPEPVRGATTRGKALKSDLPRIAGTSLDKWVEMGDRPAGIPSPASRSDRRRSGRHGLVPPSQFSCRRLAGLTVAQSTPGRDRRWRRRNHAGGLRVVRCHDSIAHSGLNRWSGEGTWNHAENQEDGEGPEVAEPRHAISWNPARRRLALYRHAQGGGGMRIRSEVRIGIGWY